MSPVRVRRASPWTWARPKSATQRRPSASSSRLAGLMSRWRMPRAWAWSSASAACKAQAGDGADVGAVAGRGARGRAAIGVGDGGPADLAGAAGPWPSTTAVRPTGPGRAIGREPESSRAARAVVRSRPGPGRGRRPGQAVEPAELGDDLGEAAALDELHGVVVHAALGADGVDRDDVGVVQAGGGLGLELEPLELAGVQGRGEGQDLQGHPAAERDLLGLVDDPHAAAADLAEEAEVAEPARPDGLGRRTR